MQEHEQQIRERAYELWQQAGRPDGRELEFWYQASCEIRPDGSGQDIQIDAEGQRSDSLETARADVDQLTPTVASAARMRQRAAPTKSARSRL